MKSLHLTDHAFNLHFYRIYVSVAFIGLLSLAVCAEAQLPNGDGAYSPPPREAINTQNWQKIVDHQPYKQKKSEQVSEEETDLDGISISPEFGAWVSTIAWVLIVGLLIGLLVYVVYRLKSAPDLSVATKDYGATDKLLGASKEELSQGLTDSMDEANFRQAIRMRFGQVLQMLRQQGLLVWVPGHTNEDYLAKLPQSLQDKFSRLAQQFAYATYAGRVLAEADYDQFEYDANDFLLSSSSSTANQIRSK